MATITSYGLKDYSKKYHSDVVNLIIDIGLLTQGKIRSNKKLEFYDTVHRLWLTRQRSAKDCITYRAYKTAPRTKEPTEEKAVLLFEVVVTPIIFDIKELTRGEWETTLKELVSIKDLSDKK